MISLAGNGSLRDGPRDAAKVGAIEEIAIAIFAEGNDQIGRACAGQIDDHRTRSANVQVFVVERPASWSAAQ